MRTLLLRHAVCGSCGPTLAGRTAGIELGSAGERQAAVLAESLRKEPLAAVYTSPLTRAAQTAQAVAAVHGLEPVHLDALQELDYGAWTGRSVAELANEPRWQAYNRCRSCTSPPGGESAFAVQARALRELLRLREMHADDTVALITHAEVVRTIVAFCLGVPLDLSLRIEIAPASVTRIQWYPDQVIVECVNSTAEAW